MAYSSIVLYFFYVVSLEVLTTEWLFSVNPETNFNFILSSQAASCVEIVVLCIKWVETAADVSEILTKKHTLIERKNNQNNIFFKLPPSLLITQQQIYVYILIKHFQSILGQCVTWFFCCLNTFKKINSTETSGHWISEMNGNANLQNILYWVFLRKDVTFVYYKEKILMPKVFVSLHIVCYISCSVLCPAALRKTSKTVWP